MRVFVYFFIIAVMSCSHDKSDFKEESSMDQRQLSDTTIQKFYDNGNLKEDFRLKDGVVHGQYKAYHSNGKLSLQGGYDSGRFVGRWEYYDAEERFDSVTEYSIVNTKSEINRKWVFDKNGDTINERSFYYITQFYKDTIEIGEFNSLYIMLENPYFGDQLTILLGGFDKGFSNVEEVTTDSLWLTTYGFQYNFISYKPGKNVVRLIAVDLDKDGRAKYFFIEEEFFVVAEYSDDI